MRDGHKVFSHGDGLIIVSINKLVNSELQNNAKFVQYQVNHPTLTVWLSHNLLPEITTDGLPKSIFKFLHSFRPL